MYHTSYCIPSAKHYAAHHREALTTCDYVLVTLVRSTSVLKPHFICSCHRMGFQEAGQACIPPRRAVTLAEVGCCSHSKPVGTGYWMLPAENTSQKSGQQVLHGMARGHSSSGRTPSTRSWVQTLVSQKEKKVKQQQETSPLWREAQSGVSQCPPWNLRS
jgi:hypothetical protein